LEEVSGLVISNIRLLGKQSYSKEEANALIKASSPQEISERWAGRETFVATEEGKIVGVAGLKGDKVKNVFVQVPSHGKGIGKFLIEKIESLAKERELKKLWVEASLDAEKFYLKMGFKKITQFKKKMPDGTKVRMLKMKKKLEVLE